MSGKKLDCSACLHLRLLRLATGSGSYLFISVLSTNSSCSVTVNKFLLLYYSSYSFSYCYSNFCPSTTPNQFPTNITVLGGQVPSKEEEMEEEKAAVLSASLPAAQELNVKARRHAA